MYIYIYIHFQITTVNVGSTKSSPVLWVGFQTCQNGSCLWHWVSHVLWNYVS